jgi:sarcosine reductase
MKRKILMLFTFLLCIALTTGATVSFAKSIRLEVGNIYIKDVQLSKKTEIKNGVLFVNAEELKSYLEKDKRLGRVDIDIANPGDRTRIVRVEDVYEPVARTGNRKGEFPFPGVLGEGLGLGFSSMGAGSGSINKLKGAAVVICQAGAPPDAQKAPSDTGDLIQMFGKGTTSDFAKTHNVIIVPYPAKGLSPDDYTVAIRVAGIRAAAYLGKASQDLKPDKVEVFERPPLTQVPKGMEKLPKVAYVFMMGFGNTRPVRDYGVNVGEPVLYGGDAEKLTASIIHPNEVLDGAVLMQAGGYETSYEFQNHPVIKDLYRRHGKDLNFVGVVLAKDHPGPVERQRAVSEVVRNVVGILGADGAVVTKYGGGAPQNFVAQIAVGLSKQGVKTALMPWSGCYVIFTQPEANAVISTGHMNMKHEMEAVDKVIGFHHAVTPDLGKYETTFGGLPGAMNQIGSQNNKCVETPGDIYHMLPETNVVMEKNGAERAVQMVMDKIAKKPIKTEVRLDVYPPIKPPPAVKDVSKAKIALVSSTGLWPVGAPKFQPIFCDQFITHNIKGLSSFDAKAYGILHFGYQQTWARQNPNRLIALPELRQLEAQGKIGKIMDTMYCFSGLANRWGDMIKIGEGILPELRKEGVDAVLLVST